MPLSTRGYTTGPASFVEPVKRVYQPNSNNFQPTRAKTQTIPESLASLPLIRESHPLESPEGGTTDQASPVLCNFCVNAAIFLCSRCQKMPYCSAECQVSSHIFALTILSSRFLGDFMGQNNLRSSKVFETLIY